MRLLFPFVLIVMFGSCAVLLGIELMEAWFHEAARRARNATGVGAPQTIALSAKPTSTKRLFNPRPLAAYGDIVQRPLFFHGRRFPKPKQIMRPKPSAAKPRPTIAAPKPKPPPPQPPPKFVGKLHGLVLSDPVRKALISIQDQTGQLTGKWYSQYQTVAGWRITAIEADRVHLRIGSSRVVLKLHADKR